MATIGSFKKDENGGFTGAINTLTLTSKVRFVRSEGTSDNGPSHRIFAGKTEIGWGNQIRSYVLHPYQMVNDLRTNVEKGNATGVLDGDLDDFVEASLAARVGTQRA